MLLAAQRMHDGCVQAFGQGEDLGVGIDATGAAEQGDFFAVIQKRRQLIDIAVAGANQRLGRGEPVRDFGFSLLQRHIPRNHHHRHAAFGDGDAHGALQNLRQLFGARDQFHVVAALLEQALGVRGLKVVNADFTARNVRGQRQHRHTAAMGVEQAVDQMQVAGPATAGTHRQFAGQMRFSACGKGCGFFVAHVNPLDLLLAAQRVGKAVQRIADHAIHTFNAGLLKSLGDEIGYCSGHGGRLSKSDKRWLGLPFPKQDRHCIRPCRFLKRSMKICSCATTVPLSSARLGD